jgi:hypothetical protein
MREPAWEEGAWFSLEKKKGQRKKKRTDISKTAWRKVHLARIRRRAHEVFGVGIA